MVSKKQFGKFQSGIVVFGFIVIALVIAMSLFGSASGAFHLVQPSIPPPTVECLGCTGNVIGTAESLQMCPLLDCPPQESFIGGSGCNQGFVLSQDGLECIRDTNIPVSDIFGLISTILNIPFQTLITIAVLIIAIIIAIPIILIARRLGK